MTASDPNLPAPLMVEGFALYKALLDRPAQEAMIADIRAVAEAAPLFSPVTPWGKPMRVRMTSAGQFGWYADRRGYRYVEAHPSGRPWPPIPASVRAVWDRVSGSDRAPECCLVNYYAEGAAMGMHRDADEADFGQPVVSISLGDPATFRIGGTERGGRTVPVELDSGDVLVMGGEARLRYHGIARVHFGRSTLLADGGRINLTLRVVT